MGEVIGALLGTQNGRDVEIVNTFELAASEDVSVVDQDFLRDRKEQCNMIVTGQVKPRLLMRPKDKQVFPSLEFIGWYTVAARPTAQHIALHEQVSSQTLLVYNPPEMPLPSSCLTVRRHCCSSSSLPPSSLHPTTSHHSHSPSKHTSRQ